jgi:hypothetical protein
MNSPRGLLELVLQRMQDAAERAKVLTHVLDPLSPEGIMKMKDELMCTMDDIVNDSIYWKGEVEHLVRCEHTHGRWSRDRELIELLEWAIRMVRCIASKVKGLLSAVLEPGHYLTLQAMKKLKVDVVDEMEDLMSDS